MQRPYGSHIGLAIQRILNHVKGFTQVLDRNSFQLRTRKRKKSAIQGNGKMEASSKEIG